MTHAPPPMFLSTVDCVALRVWRTRAIVDRLAMANMIWLVTLSGVVDDGAVLVVERELDGGRRRGE